MDGHARMDWVCTILEYVSRQQQWGMKDVDMLRKLLTNTGLDSQVNEEIWLRRWYGEPLHVDEDIIR